MDKPRLVGIAPELATAYQAANSLGDPYVYVFGKAFFVEADELRASQADTEGGK
jgi:hypothetical protein